MGYEDARGYAGGGVVRKLFGKLTQAQRHVPGKPDTVRIPGYGDVEAAPIKELEESADSYMRRIGREGQHKIDGYQDFDEDRAARIAEAFERMKHDPQDPEVRRAYDAMISETLDQYESLKGTGIDIKFIRPGQDDPYAKSPALGYADLVKNGRLHAFPTDQGFGSGASELDVSDNPLLKRVGKIGDLDNATANDAFRVVHDTYGHFAPGNPFFRHKGEERAWENHSKMYSPEALPAMSSETRGQNSWLNFGPYAERNRTALGADTVFADQKIGLLPEWAYKGYATGGFVHAMSQDGGDDLVEDVMFAGKAARGAKGVLKSLMGQKVSPREGFSAAERDAQARTLWQNHGVGLGRRGDPFFEIDDSAARYKPVDTGPERGNKPLMQYLEEKRAWEDGGHSAPKNLVLPDILDHEELYDQYPQFTTMPVRITSAMGKGQYGGINLGDGHELGLMSIDPNYSDPLKSILHEAQHGVQWKEGWPYGSNLDSAKTQLGRQDRLEQDLLNVQSIQDMLAAGFDPEDVVRNPDFGHLAPDDLTRALKSAVSLPQEQVEAMYREARKGRVAYDDAFGVYERNEGEVQARNVMRRQPLSATERRGAFWKDTEDRKGEPRLLSHEYGKDIVWPD